MNIIEKDKRIAFEKALLKEYFPNFKVYTLRGILFVSGWITANVNRYKLRLMLPKEFPYGPPKMFIVSPRVLYTADGKSLMSLGVSHSFHTVSDVPGDYIQISYTDYCDASCTCGAVIIKGIFWIKGYEEHLRTGESIDDILRGFLLKNRKLLKKNIKKKM